MPVDENLANWNKENGPVSVRPPKALSPPTSKGGDKKPLGVSQLTSSSPTSFLQQRKRKITAATGGFSPVSEVGRVKSSDSYQLEEEEQRLLVAELMELCVRLQKEKIAIAKTNEITTTDEIAKPMPSASLPSVVVAAINKVPTQTGRA